MSRKNGGIMKNFSTYFGLPIRSHAEIDFVDIPVDTDIELFPDPTLIETGSDSFSRWCAVVVGSFFDAVFHACEQEDMVSLKSLLSHSTEPNESHLGYSMNRSMGRGASLDILFPIFSALIRQGLFAQKAVTTPNDICVLAPDFGQDRMSDLLTNILRNQLSEFTIAQCQRLGVPMDGVRRGYCWEESDGTWAYRKWICPIAYGKPVLLVPKGFVSRGYHLGTESYIQQQLLTYLQREHLRNQSSLCHRQLRKDGSMRIVKPTKKEVRRAELKGVPDKQSAISFAREHPDSLPHFNTMRLKRFSETDFSLSDHELDLLLYPDRFQTG